MPRVANAKPVEGHVEEPTAEGAVLALDPDPVPAKVPEPQDESRYQADRIGDMRKHLAAQRKVRIKLRKEVGTTTVQINGYTLQMEPGEWIQVPEQVYEMLADAGIV